MTIVKVGSARSDEHGGSGWSGKAKAGDQTGREVSTQNWYKHSKGWVVLRPKSPIVAEKIAKNMQWACDNNHIGYDQSERYTLYNVAEKVDFDCSKVTTNCETDCSETIRVCCAYAGIKVQKFRTADEIDVLMKTGQFEKLTAKRYTDSSSYLKRGDILCTPVSGHTVVVLSDGGKVAKPTTETPVNDAPKSQKTVKASKYAQEKNANLAGTYQTVSALNLRDGAGVYNKVLTVLPRGHKVQMYGYYNVVGGVKWFYVETQKGDTTYIGFCSSRYLKKC